MTLKQQADSPWSDVADVGPAGPLDGAGPSPSISGSDLSPTLTAEAAYLSGMEADGTAAARSFWTDQETAAHKWGPALAGTTGGVVTYSFASDRSAAAVFTQTEQRTVAEALSLWSAVADVTFRFVATGGAVTFRRGTDGGDATTDLYGPTTSSDLQTTTSALVSIDTAAYGFDLSGSFTTVQGYGLGSIVHEVGHVLGLGHAGDYDGSAVASTDQYSAYDTRLWSVMSYITPGNPAARYFDRYPVTGTDWQGAQTPTTMMVADLLAIQSLYGAAVSGPLSGGQVFGFHTNLAASIRPFFDFTVNAAPVVTIWDGGTGNTLDLSGYADGSRVDLNPGTFSSVAGLVNDIAIAFGTAIDTAVGGTGDDRFVLNGDGDTVTGGGGSDTAVFAGASSAYSLARAGSTVTAIRRATGVTDTLHGIATLSFDDGAIATADISCFTHGTAIAVPGGTCPVEALSIGDPVLTADGRVRRLKWVGRRAYAARFASRNPAVQPVLIRAGALAPGLPRRDLRVSRNHALLLDGHLVPAGELVDGARIVIDRTPGDIAYVHLELADHDAVLAEGVPAETFVPEAGRRLFANAAEYALLYPDEVPRAPRHCAPRLLHGPALHALRQRLARVPSMARSA